MDEQTRLQAREHLLRSRIYRFVALVCLLVGLGIFLALYFRYVEGDIVAALKKPATILILLIPFLPAAIIAHLAARSEKKCIRLIEQLQTEPKPPARDEKK